MRHLIASSVILAALAGCAAQRSALPVQSGVDLQRYAGTWHEQARLPNRFQDDCAGEVQADYGIRPDGAIDVVNQCRTRDGATKTAHGLARLSRDADPPDPAKLQVRFAPAWTSWLPMVWGDYWILHLQDGYRHALVGTPDRKYLWVLSRDRRADRATVDALLDHARSLGFDTDRVVRTAGSAPSD
jgi:Bacterial lipocalin